MLLAGFEPAVAASEGPQNHVLDRAAKMCDILRYDDDLGRGVQYVALPVSAFTAGNGFNHKTIPRCARWVLQNTRNVHRNCSLPAVHRPPPPYGLSFYIPSQQDLRTIALFSHGRQFRWSPSVPASPNRAMNTCS